MMRSNWSLPVSQVAVGSKRVAFEGDGNQKRVETMVFRAVLKQKIASNSNTVDRLPN